MRTRSLLLYVVVIGICLGIFTLPSFAQYHPELEWRTIETPHFYVHYHNGSERSANVVAKIAEDVYAPITSLYQHEPDQKVSFIIKDYDDYSNGAAYFYDNKVEIWAPSMDFDFRGTHNWLRNVITHEFTHIVQIQTTMKFGRRMPGVYLQWLGYESERRQDVLYGFPNVIASYPFSGFVVPVWFAEGVAQYNRPQLRYDFWDSHRDMILRSYALKDSLLTWQQMGVFGKTSLGNESSYNAGFAFVYYVAQQYGIEKLNEISRDLSSLDAVTIDGAIEKAIGKTGETVYNEWRDAIKAEYARRVAPIRESIEEGNPILFVDDEDAFKKLPAEEQGTPLFTMSKGLVGEDHRDRCGLFVDMGFANLYPSFSPDGTQLAFVSTAGAPYLGQSQLIIGKLGGKSRAVAPKVGRDVSWSPDGRRVYFSRVDNKNPHFSLQSDLYVYDIESDQERRLTEGLRGLSPSVSPDGKQLVCVVGKDGTSNLVTMNVDGSNVKFITSYAEGEQVYEPKWSPDGTRIVFAYSVRDGRDLAWIRPDGTDREFLVKDDSDVRTPAFSPDGSRILFAWDKTGIFNIYSYDVAAKGISQLTNVLGGAFMPTTNARGALVYSNYTNGGYKLYLVDSVHVIHATTHSYLPLQEAERGLPQPVYKGFADDKTDTFDWKALRTYDDNSLPDPHARDYRNIFTSLSIVPFVRFDNYNTKNKALESIKAGVYLFSNDVLDKLSMFGGAAFNSKLERDLFVNFSYRGRLPLFYNLGLEPVASLELYNVTRKTGNFVTLPALDPIPVDITYNLTEFDVALAQATQAGELEFRYAHSRYTSTLEAFILPGPPPVLVSGTDDRYLIGNDLTLKWDLQMIARSNTAEINPVGRRIRLTLNRSLNKFAATDSNGYRTYELTPTGLQPKFDNINFTRVELNWREHLGLPFKDHTLTLKGRGGSVLGPAVDGFFDFYAGGLIGMRGYPFYSISGNELAVLGLEYRFPLIHNIDVRFLQFYFDKLYASVYADVGNAWTGEVPRFGDFKKDVGLEVRLESFSFYAYPTRIFFSASYGLDSFERFVRSTNQTVTYGKEWRFYFGMLFDFDFE